MRMMISIVVVGFDDISNTTAGSGIGSGIAVQEEASKPVDPEELERQARLGKFK